MDRVDLLRRVAPFVLAASACTAAHGQGLAGRLFDRAPSVPTAAMGASDASAAVATDNTPPVLTVFDAGTTWSMNRGAVPLSVLVKGTDDLSGLSHILIEVTGPSGQSLYGYAAFDYPVLSVSRRLSLNAFYDGRMLEPGAWTIVRARLVDTAGNPRKVQGAALAALGNTAFTVVNTGSFDNIAPTLVSGQLLTTSVSLSGTAKGTTQAPFVGVKLGVADTGASGVAGVAAVHAAFCLADETRCLDVMQTTPLGGNAASATITIGRQVSAALGDAPGEYLLYEIVLVDHAGNARSLLSTVFGGTTDFGALFAATKITLKP